MIDGILVEFPGFHSESDANRRLAARGDVWAEWGAAGSARGEAHAGLVPGAHGAAAAAPAGGRPLPGPPPRGAPATAPLHGSPGPLCPPRLRSLRHRPIVSSSAATAATHSPQLSIGANVLNRTQFVEVLLAPDYSKLVWSGASYSGVFRSLGLRLRSGLRQHHRYTAVSSRISIMSNMVARGWRAPCSVLRVAVRWGGPRAAAGAGGEVGAAAAASLRCRCAGAAERQLRRGGGGRGRRSSPHRPAPPEVHRPRGCTARAAVSPAGAGLLAPTFRDRTRPAACCCFDAEASRESDHACSQCANLSEPAHLCLPHVCPHLPYSFSCINVIISMQSLAD